MFYTLCILPTYPLLPLLLLISQPVLSQARLLRPGFNGTKCCEAAIRSSATDRTHFPLNFALWNEYVQLNHSIPPFLENTPSNAPWNTLVASWHTDPKSEYFEFKCGAVYTSLGNSETPAVMEVMVPLKWCRVTPPCMGYESVPIRNLEKWAGPVVGFLLPSVVFGLSIERSWSLKLFSKGRSFPQVGKGSLAWHTRGYLSPVRKVFGPPVIMLVVLFVSAIDMVFWAAVILTTAGPTLASALDEMYLDHMLLNRLFKLTGSGTSRRVELQRRTLLLAVLLSNVSDPSGILADSATASMESASAENVKISLKILLRAQRPFDVAVCSPVAFYIGAYLYAICDAHQRLGDDITAAALMFGLWYSVFVLIATVLGCLLGCSNTAVIENVLPLTAPGKDVHLVSPWDRGWSTRQWAHRLSNGEWVSRRPRPLSSAAIGAVSIFLVTIPCGLGLFVSPIEGLVCRSFTLLLYWFSQVLLILLHGVPFQIPDRLPVIGSSRLLPFSILTVPCLILSLSSGLVGTIMQMTGFFRNVYCMAGIPSFHDPDSSRWWLNIATDTLKLRNLARYRWRYTGVAGLSMMGIVCATAWWYQRDVKRKCVKAIETVQELRMELEVQRRYPELVEDVPMVVEMDGRTLADATEGGTEFPAVVEPDLEMQKWAHQMPERRRRMSV